MEQVHSVGRRFNHKCRCFSGGIITLTSKNLQSIEYRIIESAESWVSVELRRDIPRLSLCNM